MSAYPGSQKHLHIFVMICKMLTKVKILSFSAFVPQVGEHFTFPQDKLISAFGRRILLLIFKMFSEVKMQREKMY